MNNFKNQHFGKYIDSQLSSMSSDELIEIIKNLQGKNFIMMTDSYKMTHHLLLPEGIEEMYSYMEPRGGEMEYTVFFGLQYYLMEYIAGIRITLEDINYAHQKNIEHFGFDCFNREMWEHILYQHDGKLPLRIKAVKEGSVVPVKNVLMSIQSTDKKCVPLANITETMLMKLWAPNTGAAYSRHIKELVVKYHKLTSDVPEFMIDLMVHDFGYRGTSSEETSKICSSAHLINFKSSDTLSSIPFLEKYYGCVEMPCFSVIASEHAVPCSFGGIDEELTAYEYMITNVRKKCPKAFILSLVSDTYNIFRVCRVILPKLQHLFVNQFNEDGIPFKLVVRPDSGDPIEVLFGNSNSSDRDVQLGVYGILFEEFGCGINSKGFKTLNQHIGVLQGDGISLKSINTIYEKMYEIKIDTMMLVFGSGGKLLQAHDRDEQKYAIKATYVKVNGEGRIIQKDPITDPGKKSKKGYLKLVIENGVYRTVEMTDKDYDLIENDELELVFEDGEIKRFQLFSEIRDLAKIC